MHYYEYVSIKDRSYDQYLSKVHNNNDGTQEYTMTVFYNDAISFRYPYQAEEYIKSNLNNPEQWYIYNPNNA